METLECIARRRSYRERFQSLAVSRADLEKIVLAGVQAPSGCNKQTTEFVAVDDPDVLFELRKFSAMPAVQTATAMIFCITDRIPAPAYSGRAFQIEDCAAAVQNMLLAIVELGYASVWVQGGLMAEGKADYVGHVLRLPPHKQVFIMLPVGVPEDEVSEPAKQPVQARVFFNRYGK